MEEIAHDMGILGVEENNLSEQDADADCDTVEEIKINELFERCKLTAEDVTDKGNYVLHLDGTPQNNYLAAALSNNRTVIYNLSDSKLDQIALLKEHADKIVGLKFKKEAGNVLLSGSADGTIKTWDLRVPQKAVVEFKDTTDYKGKLKVFTCFDLAANDMLLAAGTEITDGDAYILFWDVRNTNLLGGYWETHTDDITDIKFHSNNADELMSGSVDGLINTYDLTENAEDDAWRNSLNTNSSVEKLMWFKNKRESDCIACITHTGGFQLWTEENAEALVEFSRRDIATAIRRENEEYCYLCGTHEYSDGLLLFAGSNYGEGECFRGVYVEQDGDKFNMKRGLNFPNNGQIVRCSWMDRKKDVLVTGGEKGTVNVWRMTQEDDGIEEPRRKRQKT